MSDEMINLRRALDELEPIVETNKKYPIEEMIGKKFGRLRIEKYLGSKNKYRYYYLCKCDCGKEAIVEEGKLRTGNTRSCGCLAKEVAGERMRKERPTHHASNTRLYRIYQCMIQRCYRTYDQRYDSYGGRGIKVCEEWQGKNGFIKFKEWAISNNYEEHLSIDRIDNDKGYSPENCRWVTNLEQSNNRRNNHFLTYQGRTMTIAQWSRELGLNQYVVSSRLQRGWSDEEALCPDLRKRRKENAR